MLNVGLVSASAAGGRFTPAVPTLSYLGSGTSNLGKWSISNYDSTYIYTVTGSGSLVGNTLSVSDSNGSATVTARSPKGITASAGVTAFRKTPTQTFIATGPFACYGCASPGFQAPCCAPGPCGCGTFHQAGAFPYTGFWACCTPGYYVYDNYAPTWTWSGSDYTNGQGEWWRVA